MDKVWLMNSVVCCESERCFEGVFAPKRSALANTGRVKSIFDSFVFMVCCVTVDSFDYLTVTNLINI